MTGSTLNGTTLGNSDALVYITAHSPTLPVRQAKTAIHGGTQDRQKTGTDLPTINLTLTVVGQGTAKFTVLRDIVDVLETDEVWTLQVPTNDDNLYLYLNHKRAPLSTESVSPPIINRAQVQVEIQATINGIWIADGGAYCEKINGNFTYDGADFTIHNMQGLQDQDGNNTGATPLVTLPEQTAGYPKAIKDDLTEGTPTLDSTQVTVVDGNIVTQEKYDMTGFLIPSTPNMSGENGIFQLCSSPTEDYLDTDDALTASGSITVTGTGTATITPNKMAAGSIVITGAGTAYKTEDLETQAGVTLETQAGQPLEARIP